MNIDGACYCGRCAYEAEIDPNNVAMCHCADCQTLSGTAFRILVYVPEEKFRLLKGTPKSFVKIAESGRRRILAFCPECGSSLYSVGEDEPRVFAVRVGTSRQRAELAPKRQYWCRSALPWLPEMEELERLQQQ